MDRHLHFIRHTRTSLEIPQCPLKSLILVVKNKNSQIISLGLFNNRWADTSIPVCQANCPETNISSHLVLIVDKINIWKNKQVGIGGNEHKTLQRLHRFKLKEPPRPTIILLQQSWIKALRIKFLEVVEYH